MENDQENIKMEETHNDVNPEETNDGKSEDTNNVKSEETNNVKSEDTNDVKSEETNDVSVKIIDENVTNDDENVTDENVKHSEENNHDNSFKVEDEKREESFPEKDVEKLPEKIDSGSTRNESCGNRLLHCLSQVPCASLIAWIILLVGLGGLTGGLLIGIQKTRDLVDSDGLLWFLEYTVAGVVAGMFVFGTILLCVGHISTDPTSRHIFHTTKRNLCAQGLNITMLILSYIFGILWVLLTAIFGVPLYLLVNIIIIQDDVKKINLVNYGLHEKIIEGNDFDDFLVQVDRLLVIYITIFVSSILITISMINFLIVLSSNLTHLKDTRLATLNAYADQTEMQNSKHSVVDTTM